MLCRKELDDICRLAEDWGFRTNFVSVNYVMFLYEYIDDYDIILTYSTTEGEAHYEIDIDSPECMSQDEFKTLYVASQRVLELIQHMGGIKL